MTPFDVWRMLGVAVCGAHSHVHSSKPSDGGHSLVAKFTLIHLQCVYRMIIIHLERERRTRDSERQRESGRERDNDRGHSFGRIKFLFFCQFQLIAVRMVKKGRTNVRVNPSSHPGHCPKSLILESPATFGPPKLRR